MSLEFILRPGTEAAQAVYLATVAIGQNYFADWERHSLPSWQRYAESNGYGLAVLKQSALSPSTAVAWNKFLLPEMIWGEDEKCSFTLILDADQTLSPIAPELPLDQPDKLGLVHIRDWSDTTLLEQKLTAVLRKRVLEETYPLDSTLVMSESDWRDNRLLDLGGNLPISSGFILVPTRMVSDVARLVLFSTDPASGWDGGGGDQQFASREFQRIPHYFLDQRWQGIWPSIMAKNAAYLYLEAPVSRRAARLALVSALLSHWCVHFATSWPEKEYWKVDWMAVWDEYFDETLTQEMRSYIHSSITAQSYGRIVAPETRLVQEI